MLNFAVRKFFGVFAFASAFIMGHLAAGDYQVEFQPAVIEKAASIECTGVLKQKKSGYVYLEVSNDFIGELLPLVAAPGKMVPPHHYTNNTGIGAHISVMYEDELIHNEIWEIAELGQQFTFTVEDLRTVKCSKEGKTQKFWILVVDAPQLEQLRIGYGLSSKLKGHDFHITIGTQVPGSGNPGPSRNKKAA